MVDFNLVHYISNWSDTHTKFLIGVGINIVLIYGICKAIDVINKRVIMRLKVKVDDYPVLALVPIIFQALKFLIAFLLIAGFLQSFGYNVTSLVAGFGITGLAVAFAAQTTIGNVFGSFSILSDKVFKIGDYIKFADGSGRVEGINLRSTQIRTVEGFLINVPNNVLANASITNLTKTSKYKIEVVVAIECDTPIERVRRALEIIQDIADAQEEIDKPALTFVESVENTAINLKLFGYTTTTYWKNYVKLRSHIIEEIIGRFQKEGISLDIPDSRLSIVRPNDLFGVYASQPAEQKSEIVEKL